MSLGECCEPRKVSVDAVGVHVDGVGYPVGSTVRSLCALLGLDVVDAFVDVSCRRRHIELSIC